MVGSCARSPSPCRLSDGFVGVRPATVRAAAAAQPPPPSCQRLQHRPSPRLQLLFVVLLLPLVADGLKLYLTYPSEDGGDGGDLTARASEPTTKILRDVSRYLEVSAALSNVSVELHQIPCDGARERATAARWASDPDPPVAIVGGCCDEGGACQSALPQILYESKRGSPMSLYMYPSLESAGEAMAALAKHMKWKKLTVVAQKEPMDQVAQTLLRSLADSDVFARLASYNETSASTLLAEQPDYDGLVWLGECGGLQALWRQGALRLGTVLVPLRYTGPSAEACLPSDFDGFVFIEGQTLLSTVNAPADSKGTAANYTAGVGVGIRTRLAIDSVAAMVAASRGASNGDLNVAARNTSFVVQGLTGNISFSASGSRLYDVTIRQYIQGAVVRTYAYNSTALGDIETCTIDSAQECRLAANVAATLLGMQLVLGTGFAVAMIAFNWIKRKDRMIKLTSPNLNVVTCSGCIAAYISVVLLGIGEPWIEDLQLLARLKQAGAFLLSTAMTIVLGSVFLKTWRIYRIFTKPHSKGTVTRDEHLLLMLAALLIIDVVIHVVWLTTDPYSCVRDTSSAVAHAAMDCDSPEATAVATCTSRNAGVWYALLYSYKLALLAATAYCAARIRHVSHPSLNDSGSTFASAWSIAVASLCALPLLLCEGGRWQQQQQQLGSFAALVLAAFLAITSSLLWQFVPKILWSMKNKDLQGQIKFRHTPRTKQSGPPKAKDSKQLGSSQPRPPSPRAAQSRRSSVSRPHWLRGSRKSDRDACDALLRQELECLKLKLKEKDETIRELTDRLFFDAGHFRAYVERKASTTSGVGRRSVVSSSADSGGLETPRWSAASTSADDDDDSDCYDDGVFVTDVPCDFVEANARGDVAPNEASHPSDLLRRTMAAAVVGDRRRIVAGGASGFDAAAFSTGVQLNASRVLADGGDGGGAEAGAPKPEAVAGASFGLGPSLPLSLLSDEDEPDSGVYTASCSEKGFAGWPRSARRTSTDVAAAASGYRPPPPPPSPPQRVSRTRECPATSSSDLSAFLVEPSRVAVATMV